MGASVMLWSDGSSLDVQLDVKAARARSPSSISFAKG
jgi:hypothetical protein